MDYNWLGDCEKFHRRDFLRVGVLSMLGLSLSKYFALADTAKKGAKSPQEPMSHTNGTADSAILIWLAGGPSHIDTFDPKPDAPLEIRGNFKAINTRAGGMQLSEHLPVPRFTPNFDVNIEIRIDLHLRARAAQQDDLARLLVMHHQRVRICDYVHSRRRAGADVVDYVTLTGIQGESHCRAVVGEQQAGPKHKHADSCN